MSAEREPIGKRLRFEILKRDGFKCRYCGAMATATLLHVDHVVAVADGGTNDPANLVAACVDCNQGKSCVSLDESRLPGEQRTNDMLEHAEQIRAYLGAAQEVASARKEIAQEICNYWCDQMGKSGIQASLFNSFPHVVDRIGLIRTYEAVDITANKRLGETDSIKYFRGIVRKMSANAEHDL